MRVPDAIAEILKREGVEFLVAYPVNPVIEAAAKADIRTIIVRQERIGLHMADGFSRVMSGRKVGVFAMQHGPGSENAFGGVAQAYGDSSPILVLPGGYPRQLTNVPPNFNAFLNYQHVTKSCEQLTDPGALTDVMRRSFAHLRSGRPGPVLVEVPRDLWGADVGEELDYAPTFQVRSAPDPEAVPAAVDALLAAEQPLIYAGQGVHYAQAWDALRELAELLDCPVTTSLGGKSAFPEDHPLSLGSGGRSVPKAVQHFLQKSDVLLGIGCSFTRTGYGVSIPAGKTVIHATLDPNDINKDVRAGQAFVGDAELILEALIAEVRTRLSDPRDTGVRAQIAELKQEWLADWEPRLTSAETPLSPYRVLWDLMHTVDRDNTIITHDAGSPRDQLSPFWESTQPLSYIGWGKTTQLGYGLGLAMGANWPGPTSSASTFGATLPSASRAWTSRRQSASGSQFFRSCSITSPWRSSCPSCRRPPRSTAAPTSLGTTPTWRRPSVATANASRSRPTSSRRFSAASPRPRRASPR